MIGMKSIHSTMEKEKPRLIKGQGTSSTRDQPPSPPSEQIKDTKNSEEFNSILQKDVTDSVNRLLGFTSRKSAFYKSLEEALALDYAKIKSDIENDRVPEHLPKYPAKEGYSPTVEEKATYYCNLLRNECYDYIEPLHGGLGLSIAAAIETHTAFVYLNKLHDILDKVCDMLDQNYRVQVYMQDLKTLTELKSIEKKDSEHDDVDQSDPESDIDINLSLLNSILEAGENSSIKRLSAKQRGRERSMSMIGDIPESKDLVQPPFRRQSAYTEGKAKVSKWTKVKAAFKWERANVPAVNESKSSDSGIAMTSINHEVARYLRVPSVPCGGSSADSILSSSSGHFLSETGTPGTISSASSVDDIERASQTNRRDSSKSDSKCDSRITENNESHRSHSIDGDMTTLYTRHEAHEIKESASIQVKHQRNVSESSEQRQSPATSQGSLDRVVEVTKKTTTKTSSLKSMRKSKIVPDFETLPEDIIADIVSTPKRSKPLPSPLNLSLKHDLAELDNVEACHSPNVLTKSPWEKKRTPKLQSPGNSSVPSSPSRHSEFFAEFESEELSSGDFSEPTTPHSKLFSNNNLQMQQEEIHQRYNALREMLRMEFEAKQQEWNKFRGMCSNTKPQGYHFPLKDDPLQQQSKSMSTKLLEENLTPDFKKKLHKWRVKKQISLHGLASSKEQQTSPSKDSETKKIDWNLWRTGQIKLEGQGLSPLPDQKDLSEEFQKKLDQWNKLKSSGMPHSGHDLIKRPSKSDSAKKHHEDEKQKAEKEKQRALERERLSKLKSIVADPRAKEIEVKTTAGVMKFEGISRKFTRKLYEWEKARGIGPESSTFALLHPGYCPIDVGQIPKEGPQTENSPTLSRSLSLDSLAPNLQLSVMSHQTSSLSLNDVNGLNEAESTDAEQRIDSDLKPSEEAYEPEAVMVEVEDDIVETASPLVAVLPMAEHQTPVYKYAEITCNDYCKSRSIQSFETYPNNAGDKIKTLNYINDLWLQLDNRNELNESNHKYSRSVFSAMKNSFPDFEKSLTSTAAKKSFVKVKELVDSLFEINNVLQLDEACCQEIINERQTVFRKTLDELHVVLNEVRQHIESERMVVPAAIPEINVTSDENMDTSYNVSSSLVNTAMAIATATLSASLETPPDINPTISDNIDVETARKPPIRNFSNGSTKKKLRLRKMGSRQNSKTESDSSDDDCTSVLETPRRVKRKVSSRIKQRSFDEDRRSAEESRPTDDANVGEDIVYVLKVKPGQPIEQQEIPNDKGSKLLISPTESCVQIIHTPISESFSPTTTANIFVKTKRKVFTTVEEPGSLDRLAVVATDLDRTETPSKEIQNDLDRDTITNIGVKSSISPGIKSMISKLFESMPLDGLANFVPHENVKPYNYQRPQSLSSDNIFKKTSCIIDRPHSSSMPVKSKSLSFENLKNGWESYEKKQQVTRPFRARTPLANDSFKMHKRTSSHPYRRTASPSVATEKREHLFRKNKSMSPIAKIGVTGKRIETKIAKSLALDDDQTSIPDKSDNSVPKIARKWNKKSLTPTSRSSNFDFQEPLPEPSKSEPATPSMENLTKPKTPLSERALRLQRAKEEFLKGNTLPKVNLRREDSSELQRTKEKWENRHSQHSMCSDASTSGIDECMLLKSVSVGMLPADSDCSERTTEECESLASSVARSGKFSSKLGFSTLASKFRRVKLRRGSKDIQPPPKENVLTALCRQSLVVDLNPSIQKNLMKSQSSQAAICRPTAHPEATEIDVDKLNKSKSDHYFALKNKESYV